MNYWWPHFLGCACQCESKRQHLQTVLTTGSFNKLSVSRRSFLLIYRALDGQGGRPKPSHDIQYDEYQCIGAPTHTLVTGRYLRGNIGDLYIDKTPGSYALYAKTSATEWKKWPGPLSITDALRHPLYPHYVLWCHPSTRTIGWFFDLLVNKPNLDGSDHDVIYAILEERREAEVTRNKQSTKRKEYPSEGQEIIRKKLKWMTDTLHNDSQFVSTKRLTSPTTSVDPASAALEEIVRLRREAIRLQNAHTALQELVTTTHPVSSLAADMSISPQQKVSNLLGRPSPHSSIPDGSRITTPKSGLDSSSPKPLKSDVPLSPSSQCIPNEGDGKPRSTSANASDDNSKSMDTVLTTLTPEREANVNASSLVNTTDAINLNTFKDPIIADEPHQTDASDTCEHDSRVERETGIESPSNDVDCITTDEPDHRDIDMGSFIENAASTCLSPVSIPSEPLVRPEESISPKHESRTGNHVREITGEGAGNAATEALRLDRDLHSDEALVTIAVTSDSEKNSYMTCNQPFAQRMDPPPTNPEHVVMKDITPALSNQPNFRLNYSLKEIIFYISNNSGLICRLCLGSEPSHVHCYSMDASLQDLSNHCVKEHLPLCEILWDMSAEELDGLKQNFTT